MENDEEQWKTIKTMKNYGKLWKMMKNGKKTIKNNEKQWKTMKNNEKLWKTMKNNEEQWKNSEKLWKKNAKWGFFLLKAHFLFIFLMNIAFFWFIPKFIQ